MYQSCKKLITSIYYCFAIGWYFLSCWSWVRYFASASQQMVSRQDPETQQGYDDTEGWQSQGAQNLKIQFCKCLQPVTKLQLIFLWQSMHLMQKWLLAK